MASYKVDSLASPADLGHSDKQSESGRAKQLQAEALCTGQHRVTSTKLVA